jgi:hypothetical protein
MSKLKVFPFHIKSGPWTGKISNTKELKKVSYLIKSILPFLQSSSAESSEPEFIYVDKPLTESNLYTHLKQGGVINQI